jgi:hypothetical protein
MLRAIAGWGTRRRFVVALCALTGLAVAGLSGFANAEPDPGTSTSSITTPLDLDSPDIQQQLRDASKRERARSRRRATPEGRAARTRSRTAYEDLTGGEAAALAKQQFGQLFGRSRQPGPRPGDGRIERYVNDFTAVLDTGTTHPTLVESTEPLRVADETGTKRPVDLALEDQGSWFAPKNSRTPLRLGKTAGAGLSLPGTGLGVTFSGRSAAEGSVLDGTAVYPEIATDSDMTLQPAPGGVSVAWQLRSAESQEDFALSFDLPDNATLSSSADSAGGAQVTRDGERLFSISPVYAEDADGVRVPAHYSIEGNSLTAHVDHQSGDWHYPILVDPEIVNEFHENLTADPALGLDPQGWAFSSGKLAVNGGEIKKAWDYASYGFTRQGLYSYAAQNVPFQNGDWGEWRWTSPGRAYIYKALFGGIRHQPVRSYLVAGLFIGAQGTWDWGTWTTPGGGPSGTGPYVDYTAHSNGASVQKMVCAKAACATTDGTPGNFALMGLRISADGQSTQPAIGGFTYATLYLNDNDSPTADVDLPDNGTDVPTKWVTQGANYHVKWTAKDDGLGVSKKELITRTGTQRLPTAADGPICTGRFDSPCKAAYGPHDMQFDATTWPEGDNLVTLKAYDIIGHTGGKDLHVKLDHTEPAVDVSGELDTAQYEPRLANDSPTLTVNTADENDDGAVTSGVASIKVQIDGADPTPTNPFLTSNVVLQGSDPCDGCPLDKEFQLNTSLMSNGVHTVDVIVKDLAGNTEDLTWAFTIDRTTPKPSCADPGADPEVCAPSPPSSAAAACTPGAPVSQPTSGAVITANQAVAQTQQTMPKALATSEQANLESLAISPTLTSSLPLEYKSAATVLPSTLKAPVAAYTVGSGASSACIAPASRLVGALPPVLVNGVATEYANTGPSTDTILRPTPLGVQEFTQARGAAAPETLSYQVALQPSQSLQQLDDGAIAIVDSTLARNSSTETALPTAPARVIPAAEDGNLAPGWNGHPAVSPPDGPFETDDFADALPDDPAIAPAATENQYESEAAWTRTADRETDGQVVAVLIPPWAQDASGISVPTELTIAGPSAVNLTTHHKAGSYTYPVITSHKTATTTAARKQHVTWAIDTEPLSGLYATNDPSHNNRTAGYDGAPNLIEGLKAHQARYIMTGENSCDKFAGSGVDLTHDVEWDDTQASKNCKSAVDFVVNLPPGLAPYITIKPHTTTPQPGQYAASLRKLWASYPFNQVKLWGITNEPDYSPKLSVATAAKVWRRAYQVAHTNVNGHPRCDGCRLAAGEFAYSGKNSAAWTRNYIDYFHEHKGAKPFFWALHDYADVTWQEWHPSSNGYPALTAVVNRLHRNYGKRGKIWLSEQGVVLQRGNGDPTAVKHTKDGPVSTAAALKAQKQDARRFLKLATHAAQVSQVGYYEFFGEQDAWDSAVIKPVSPREYLEGTTVFRPAYCELAIETSASVCSGGDGS